jgi:Tol biopolymer transport system component
VRRVVVSLAVVAFLGVSAPAAHATFAGRNGRIAFAAKPSDKPRSLFAIKPPALTLLRYLAVSPYEDRSPSWTPDGATLAFVSNRSGNLDIWTETNGVPLALTGTPVDRETLPTWSSDGRIAFVTAIGSSGTDTTIDVIDADGSNRVTIRSPGRPVFGLEWSPVGDRIVYAVPDQGRVDIYSIRSDGSRRVRLADDLLHAVLYDWSPDGRSIVFQGGTGNGSGLFAIAAAGTHRIRRLTTASFPGGDGHASYSPNGLKIAFVRDQGGGDEIWVMRTDGTHRRSVRSLHRFDIFGMSWQPVS